MKRLAAAVLLLALCVPARGLTADEQMRFADGIFLRGFYESAVGEYLALLRDFPDSGYAAGALYRTGECYRQMGNQAGAERFYKRVIAEHPESPQARRAELRRAEMAVADGRYADALPMLEVVLKNAPAVDETAAAATYFSGFSQWKLGKRKEADRWYAKVLADFSASPYAAYAALDLAALHAEDAKQSAKMKGWFEAALAAAPTAAVKAEVLFRWGDWAYRQGDYQAAADTLQSLLVEHPDEPRAADALLALAWSLYYLDRPDEVLVLFERLDRDMTDAETAAAAVYLQANVLRKLNRDGEALAAYARVVKEHPSSTVAPYAAYEIMATHFKRRDFAQTLATAPVRPVEGHEADVLWMRAEAARQLKNTDLARGHYETLAARFPESVHAVAALMRLGELAREGGRPDEAADWFARVPKEYPEHELAVEALKASALLQAQAGNAAGAVKTWDALLARQVDDELAAEAYLQKALVQMELDSGKALATLNTLLKKQPTGLQAARASYWRGVLLSEQEKWSDAEEAFRAALASNPDEALASLARLRLAVVLQRQDRMDEAADQMEPLLADARRVRENPALVEWLVRHRFAQGHYRRALQAAMELAHNAEEPVWRQIAWYWTGVCRMQGEDTAGAIQAFEQAIAEKAATREGAEARLLLASMLLKTGETARAEGYFTEAAAVADDQAVDLRVRAYFGLGEAAEAAGQKEKAAKHFMSVAVLYDDPEWTPHALYRAGLLWGGLGRTNEQTAVWKELRTRYPVSSFTRQTEGHVP